MATMSRTVADLRNMFAPKRPGGPVLMRPSTHGFYEFSEEEMKKAIDDVEALFTRSVLVEPSPLEQFALRILTESWF